MKSQQDLETIKNGSVILDRPLVNLRACLQALGKHHANQFLEAPRQTLYKTSLCQLLQYLENNSVATAVSKGLLFSLALFVHYTSMGFVTRFNYSPFGLNLWDSSTSLREHGIKTLLHFQHHDVVVSNEYDISLYEKLARGNPEHTYVIFGNNGGHNCKPYDLIPYAHTFRQLYGGSYNPNLALRPTALAALCKPTVVQHEPFIERLKKLTGKKL